MDYQRFQVSEDSENDRSANMLRQLQGEVEEEAPNAEQPAEESDGLEELSYDDLRKRVRELEAKRGTENDVSVLKSQRDKLRNELEQYKSQTQEQFNQVQQQLQGLTQQRTTDIAKDFETQWSTYIRQQPAGPAQQQAQAEYREKRAQFYADLKVAQQMAILEQEKRQVGEAKQQLQTIAEIESYVRKGDELARSIGVDPARLDRSNQAAYDDSLKREAERIREVRESNVPGIPPKPARGGKVARARDMQGWFNSRIANNDWQAIDDMYKAAPYYPTTEDILSRS